MPDPPIRADRASAQTDDAWAQPETFLPLQRVQMSNDPHSQLRALGYIICRVKCRARADSVRPRASIAVIHDFQVKSA